MSELRDEEKGNVWQCVHRPNDSRFSTNKRRNLFHVTD